MDPGSGSPNPPLRWDPGRFLIFCLERRTGGGGSLGAGVWGVWVPPGALDPPLNSMMELSSI